MAGSECTDEQVTTVGSWGSALLAPGETVEGLTLNLPIQEAKKVMLRVSSWLELPAISRLACYWLNTRSREGRQKKPSSKEFHVFAV